jgi:hypothetical protein
MLTPKLGFHGPDVTVQRTMGCRRRVKMHVMIVQTGK